jgi:hypothetical protein
MDMENNNLKMEIIIMVNIKIKYFMEKEFINGVMDPYIKDNFIKVKCKDLAFGNQKKIKLIKVSIL